MKAEKMTTAELEKVSIQTRAWAKALTNKNLKKRYNKVADKYDAILAERKIQRDREVW